jgi:hypothetical protein
MLRSREVRASHRRITRVASVDPGCRRRAVKRALRPSAVIREGLADGPPGWALSGELGGRGSLGLRRRVTWVWVVLCGSRFLSPRLDLLRAVREVVQELGTSLRRAGVGSRTHSAREFLVLVALALGMLVTLPRTLEVASASRALTDAIFGTGCTPPRPSCPRQCPLCARQTERMSRIPSRRRRHGHLPAQTQPSRWFPSGATCLDHACREAGSCLHLSPPGRARQSI